MGSINQGREKKDPPRGIHGTSLSCLSIKRIHDIHLLLFSEKEEDTKTCYMPRLHDRTGDNIVHILSPFIKNGPKD